MEPEEWTNLWKGMLYELHIELKSEKQFSCRYGCGKMFGIDRTKEHMKKTHGWNVVYPRLHVGQKVPPDLTTWKPFCDDWRENLWSADRDLEPSTDRYKMQMVKESAISELRRRMQGLVEEDVITRVINIASKYPLLLGSDAASIQETLRSL